MLRWTHDENRILAFIKRELIVRGQILCPSENKKKKQTAKGLRIKTGFVAKIQVQLQIEQNENKWEMQ